MLAYSDADWGVIKIVPAQRPGMLFYGSKFNLLVLEETTNYIHAKSSTEAEYRAVDHTVAETLWVHNILAELGIVIRAPIIFMCDKFSATYIVVNPVLKFLRERMKEHFFNMHNIFFKRTCIRRGQMLYYHTC